MDIGKFLPSAEGAVKIVVVVLGLLAVLAWVAPMRWGSLFGVSPNPSRFRPVQ